MLNEEGTGPQLGACGIQKKHITPERTFSSSSLSDENYLAHLLHYSISIYGLHPQYVRHCAKPFYTKMSKISTCPQVA